MVTNVLLTNGMSAMVDDWNVDRLSGYTWSYSNGYAVSGTRGNLVYMHQLIIDAADGMIVDHVNGNRLDNRESNLRAASYSQNQANRERSYKNQSGYKGVWLNKRAKRWQAEICVQGKRIHLGYFDCAEDAARAYNTAAIQHFGEFALLNKL